MAQRIKGVGKRITRFAVDELDMWCPGFDTLHWARGCPYSCQYCFLQRTFRFMPAGKAPLVYPVREVERHLKSWLRMAPELRDGKEVRLLLNAGELTDSFAHRHSDINYALRILTTLFIRPDVNVHDRRLLLLTKGSGLKRLRALRGRYEISDELLSRVIISATLNVPDFIKRFERGTPQVEKRLLFLREAKKLGFPVRVRVDPMWPDYDYSWLASRLQELKPEVVTLGTFRFYTQDFKRMGLEELKSRMELCTDKRYRLKDRVRMYADFTALLPNLRVGLCKEPISTLTQWQWESKLENAKPVCNCLPLDT